MHTLIQLLQVSLVGVVVAAGPVMASGDLATRRGRVLHLEGMKQYDLGDYPQALEAFKAGYLEKPDPVFLFNIGQCHRKLGDWQKALEAYRGYLRHLPGAPNRRLVEELIRDGEHRVRESAQEGLSQGESSAAPAGGRKVQPNPHSLLPTGTDTESAGDGKPLYRRWWLWTALGGAVAIGVGAGVGIAFAPANDAAILPASAGVSIVRFP